MLPGSILQYFWPALMIMQLEDLMVLRRSPDLINNVKKGQGFKAYNETYFVLPYMGVAAILVKWPKTILWILL